MPSVPALSGEAGRIPRRAPAAHGWVEDQVWTAARVATLIGRKFHVSCSVSGATRLMHRSASARRCLHGGSPSATSRPSPPGRRRPGPR
ncbi:winged helix-turn-helix domain-containing protein [Streptomyces sp. NPDC048324]|uniref:helix-turn-helix domain-containing protein n=1 Tax=Streptomyces sp. NPDC048324 TaxID=3157205 RepID=UPI003433D4B5